MIDLFRDNGYYYARNEFITFLADTIMRKGYVKLKIVPRQSIPEEALRTYHIGHTSVYLTGYNGEQPDDSLKLRNFTIYYSGKKPGIRYGVLRKRFLYRKGEVYSQTGCVQVQRVSIYSPYRSRKRYTRRTRECHVRLALQQ